MAGEGGAVLRPYLFTVQAPVASLGLEVGDVIVVDPQGAEPVVLCRNLPADFSWVWAAAERGELQLTDPTRSLDELSAAVNDSAPPRPASPSRRAAPPWLVRMK